MIKKTLPFIVTFISLYASTSIEAQTAPANNFQCKPAIMGSGLLPAAPPCGGSGGNLGSMVSISGTTTGATNDSLSGPITSCYPNTSLTIKDVWYQFTAFDNHVQITITSVGTTPLKDPYIAIYESANNECVGLMPRDCFSANGTGAFVMNFGPLTFGVKYYLQVASTSNSNGTFKLDVQSKNVCADCLQNSILQSYPLPVQAAYPPGDSVGFCYSVIGYKQLFGNRLHGVVPVFGNGWDVTSFVVIKTADSADFKGRWKYLKNISVKGVKYDGFFYDVGNDNDPTNNLGDQGTAATIWTFCFTIKAKTTCGPGTDDLSIHFNTFSDGESGSLNTTKDCASDLDYVFKAHMSCCAKPAGAYATTATCNKTPDGRIKALGGFSLSGYTYELFNNAGVIINKQTTTSIGAIYTSPTLPEGNYYLYITDNTTGSCTTPVNVYVPGPVNYMTQQTSSGCGSGCTNSAKIIVISGVISKYSWAGNSSTGTSASGLCAGWNTFTLTVASPSTCKIVDSIFINNLSPTNANFKYGKKNYCTSESFATISNFPGTTGGTFIIANDLTSGAGINSNTGTIPLSGLTSGGRIIVKYSTGLPCNASALDTIFVEVSPPAVMIYSNQNVCFGNLCPLFLNKYTNSINWYTDSTLTNLIKTQITNANYEPFNGAVPGLGAHVYYVTQVNSAGFACQSVPTRITITVYPIPVVNAGQDITICPGYGTVLNATGASNYTWSPANLLNDATLHNPIASPMVTTTFFVTGTDATSGCQSSDSVTVFVKANGICDVKVYTGFTPNGDNHNDYWQIDGISADDKNVVTIFNRWGEKVWETNRYDNQTNKWDGKGPSGQLLPDGTYFYVIQYKNETLKGWVELTR